MKILDKIPLQTLIVMTIFFGLSPFRPPHSVEKIGMLFNGELTQLIDMFDLVFHLTPAIILVLKIIRMNKLRNAE